MLYQVYFILSMYFFVSIFLRFFFYPQIVSSLLHIHKSAVLQLCIFSMVILKTVSTVPYPVIWLFSSSGNSLFFSHPVTNLLQNCYLYFLHINHIDFLHHLGLMSNGCVTGERSLVSFQEQM